MPERLVCVFRSVEDRLDCGTFMAAHAGPDIQVFRSVEDRLDCGDSM